MKRALCSTILTAAVENCSRPISASWALRASATSNTQQPTPQRQISPILMCTSPMCPFSGAVRSTMRAMAISGRCHACWPGSRWEHACLVISTMRNSRFNDHLSSSGTQGWRHLLKLVALWHHPGQMKQHYCHFFLNNHELSLSSERSHGRNFACKARDCRAYQPHRHTSVPSCNQVLWALGRMNCLPGQREIPLA